MPLYSDHIETGLLMTEKGEPVLQMDGGGRWRLDFDREPRDLFGHRVTVRGFRVEFDVLHVTAWAKGSEVPAEPSQWRWRYVPVIVLAVLGTAGFLWSLASQLWSLVERIWG